MNTKTINRLSPEALTTLADFFKSQVIPMLRTQLQVTSPEQFDLAVAAFTDKVLGDFSDLRNAELPEGTVPMTDLELFQKALAMNGVSLKMKVKGGTEHIDNVIQTIEVQQKGFNWRKFGIIVGATVLTVGAGYGIARWNRNRKEANAAVAMAAMNA